jgi:phage/plasmid-associated DNA primase
MSTYAKNSCSKDDDNEEKTKAIQHNTVLVINVELIVGDTDIASTLKENDVGECFYHIVEDMFEANVVPLKQKIPANPKTQAPFKDTFKYYYPALIVDPSQYDKMVKDIKSAVENEEILYNQTRYSGTVIISLDKNSQPDIIKDDNEVIEDALGNLNPRMGKEWLEAVKSLPLSFNNVSVMVDPFDFYASFFQGEVFLKNLPYIASAYRHDKEAKLVSEYKMAKEWVDFVRKRLDKLSPDDHVIEKELEKSLDFAYTIITLHEIIMDEDNHDFTPEVKFQVEKYYQEYINRAIRFALRVNPDAIGNAFAIFMRNELFYLQDDKKLYRFRGGCCREVPHMSTCGEQMIVFQARIKRVARSYKRIQLDARLEVDFADLAKRERNVLSYFDTNKCVGYVTNSCIRHLQTWKKSGFEQYGFAFRDGVVFVKGEGKKRTLDIRKTFMEDQAFAIGDARLFSRHNFTMEHRLVKKITDCFNEVFGKKADNSQAFRSWLASAFAKKPERILLILYGARGGNAKTTIMNAVSKVLGKSNFLATGDHILNEDPSSGHSAWSAQLKGMAIVSISDASLSARKLKCELIKNLTGGDERNASGKGTNPFTFRQTAKIVMLLNGLPVFDDYDQAMAERIFVLPCIAKYMRSDEWDKIDPKEREEKHLYKADHTYWEEEGMNDALLWLMTQDWKTYVEEGIVKTEDMQNATMDMFKNTMPVGKFLKNYSDPEKTEHQHSSVIYSWNDISTNYMHYYNDLHKNDNRQKIPYNSETAKQQFDLIKKGELVEIWKKGWNQPRKERVYRFHMKDFLTNRDLEQTCFLEKQESTIATNIPNTQQTQEARGE